MEKKFGLIDEVIENIIRKQSKIELSLIQLLESKVSNDVPDEIATVF